MKYLIFDFDGVLADTLDTVIKAQKQMNEVVGTNLFVDVLEYSARKPNHTRNHSLSEQDLIELNKRVIECGKLVHEIGFPLFDEFINEILLLAKTQLAIVSSGSKNYVLPALTQTRLSPTHTLTFEDHHSKEEKIELICQDWGVELEDIYYFTDTLADVYELQDFIHPDKLIGVTWGYCTKEQLLTQLPAKNLLDVPADLKRVII